jgi:transcriptional regulator with XRE-family HTH domain
MPIDRTEAGRRLATARRAVGLNQTEAAQRLGISRPDLSRIETGDRIPSWTRMVEIVTTLGLDPECVVPEFFAKAGKG